MLCLPFIFQIFLPISLRFHHKFRLPLGGISLNGLNKHIFVVDVIYIQV